MMKVRFSWYTGVKFLKSLKIGVEMILVDVSNQLASLTEKVGIETGLIKVDIPTFEVSNVNAGELYFIHVDAFKSKDGKDKCEECSHVVVFDPANDLHRIYTDGVPSNIIFHYTDENQNQIFKNLVDSTKEMYLENEMMRAQIVALNAELNETLSQVETQLLRVKKYYQKNIPVRSWEGKGIKLYLRYAAGEGNGSEFVDFYTKDDKLIVFMNRTNSYLLSSSVVAYYLEFKESDSTDLNAVELMVGNIENEAHRVLSDSGQSDVAAEIFILCLDLNTKKVNTYNIGGQHLLASNGTKHIGRVGAIPAKTDVDEFEMSLQRGERVIALSTGFWTNWVLSDKPFQVSELIGDITIKIEDILDELFLSVKKR
jgi:hypothetical protein